MPPEGRVVSQDQGRDLLSVVVDRVFAAGLALQGLLVDIDDAPTRDKVSGVIAQLDDTVRQVRAAVIVAEAGPAPDLRDAGELLGDVASMISLIREQALATADDDIQLEDAVHAVYRALAAHDNALGAGSR